MYLIFDTETTGLPKNWKAPVKDVDNWPRLVQVAWISYDEAGVETGRADRMVRPEGFEIPSDVTKIHGISQEMALENGLPLDDVLRELATAIEAAQFVVGHNVSYDEKIVGAEFIRREIKHLLWERERICTKMETTDFCKLPGKYGFKWPTLAELYHKLFEEEFEGAHQAMADVEATARCFFELQRLDVI